MGRDVNSWTFISWTEICMQLKLTFNTTNEFFIYDERNEEVKGIEDIKKIYLHNRQNDMNTDIISLFAVPRYGANEEKSSIYQLIDRIPIARNLVRNETVTSQQPSNAGAPSVIKQGWIDKKRNNNTGGWDKRYFQLTSDKMLCYSKDQSMKDAKNIIDLTDVTEVFINKSRVAKNTKLYG